MADLTDASEVYIVISAEPDSEMESAWTDRVDARIRRDDLNRRWPGMHYGVRIVPLNPVANRIWHGSKPDRG